MIPLLTYLQFNGYPIVEAKAELQKIAALRLSKKRISLKVKKKNCCIPFK
jgi:hypothetical protein